MEKSKYDTNVFTDHTNSGWQTGDSWWNWMLYLASQLSVIPGDIVFLVDSFSVHFADEALCQKLAEEHNIHLYPLVTNATQFMQPMDSYVIPAWKRHIKGNDDTYFTHTSPSTLCIYIIVMIIHTSHT